MIKIKTDNMPGWIYLPEFETEEQFLASVVFEYCWNFFGMRFYFVIEDLIIEECP